MNKFEQLGLSESLQRAIIDLGFENPTEVQEKAIPLLLEKDTDLVALAQTGTGKTAAFGFPLIQKIDANNRNTQALILSPTRELCLQITNEIKNYAKYEKGINAVAIYGGASITEQAREIKRGAQIIVATPGRMQDMINRGLVNISQINYCVLDEADEMLNMGFYEDIVNILSTSPDEKSTWLFSATMPQEVARIAKQFMHNPLEITVGTKNSGSATVSHEFYLVNARDRYEALKRLADCNPDIFSVVFCRTKRDTQQVAEKLIEDGYNAAALHGDLSQAQRDSVMKSFRGRQIQMLVATDVAARGIDVDNVTHVVNYQLPDEIETYNHRSGRTGRAGKLGTSIVIVTKSELRKIASIERIIKQKFEEKSIPSGIEICEIQLLHLANKIKDTEVDHEIDNYLPAINTVLEGLSKEDLIKKMVSVEFNRFINYYKKTKDLSTQSAGNDRNREERGTRETNTNGAVRYFVNIGSRDNFDWMTLKDWLKETLDLGRDDVFKVDVKEGFSFFNTDAEFTDRVMDVLNNTQLEGRRINVEISKNDGGGRRDHNGRSAGGFGGSRNGGGERRSGGSGFRGAAKEGGFRNERSGAREGSFRSERGSSSRRETTVTERAPRRSESFGTTPRARRTRRD
ncbi:ATP-dependent RNA helicase [Flavobacterium branchiophilum NBRC 15030 = ATCC 35035]|uniref:RNA helicase n=2 Tax=Flavobacterium branchiophilum TaxID=55197 RepID=G2Z7P2_FLABF|nr:DEAD/DEAH box helicase [Flavobacterium branchiophilum]OXA72290.1 ATP-dependent RNA helicase [Flavobacterium branchiophilum NBRC 15030 = ATCC 35035]PDS22134.1 ATP-dependent RNA helicase [Flavobacterium branchiophilum]TQM41968.1 ATP-dependent RNA helicase DeaD [Flavobacterium branchiophilum]CCB69530.1 Probable ATP-dependent RNA helicase, DEAD/DEAH box family [Flavobacterium branchiophilum FL-15]GEM55066.1 DEAD/DEAH box helicase [Flavobacterium branchiophilum NBRC 15030 = ATCC 35035]